ncbi:hypothetical protein SAMN05444002_2509 [Vannielia litorea]|uniref:Uncharacterized protein n=1 Tax=Vannielia litorea TaxID=1217970 RepID=A0A1N6GIH5_9RHOB|nr:hypothetical protein SAMN05444002_2509 [Vannielia litorea]
MPFRGLAAGVAHEGQVAKRVLTRPEENSLPRPSPARQWSIVLAASRLPGLLCIQNPPSAPESSPPAARRSAMREATLPCPAPAAWPFCRPVDTALRHYRNTGCGERSRTNRAVSPGCGRAWHERKSPCALSRPRAARCPPAPEALHHPAGEGEVALAVLHGVFQLGVALGQVEPVGLRVSLCSQRRHSARFAVVSRRRPAEYRLTMNAP